MSLYEFLVRKPHFSKELPGSTASPCTAAIRVMTPVIGAVTSTVVRPGSFRDHAGHGDRFLERPEFDRGQFQSDVASCLIAQFKRVALLVTGMIVVVACIVVCPPFSRLSVRVDLEANSQADLWRHMP